MKINLDGIKLIKSFEGCRLKAYTDSGGVWTIGYGHTLDVSPGDKITQEQAETFLTNDLIRFEEGVSKVITIPVNENQFSALVSFAFNLGLGNLVKSHLLSYLNDGQYENAAKEFPKWSNAGGMKSEGLLRRREAEQTLFLRQ